MNDASIPPAAAAEPDRRRLLAAAALAWVPATATAGPTPHAGASAQQLPQYGGTLNIGTVMHTMNALSWDPSTWPWKFNHDTGLVYEQLMAADLGKSLSRGGTHRFVADAWLPPDATRGELAESWVVRDNPFRVEFKLRKGVMFPARPGVMESRELVAEDVVRSYERLARSPRAIPGYFDHVAKVEATGRHSVLFTFKRYNSEWDYRFGWGYYSGIVPQEVVDAGAVQWKHANGTGPFMLSDYIQGNASSFVKNPVYWDKETIAGRAHPLPFVDKIVYRTIKDEATALTALRTGKLDVMELVSATAMEDLRRTTPQLQSSRWLSLAGTIVAMRMDTKPFDDLRVRRALNIAVNKQEIIKHFYRGHAELFAHPQHPDHGGYYEPLSAMPASIQELYAFDPAKARRLLAEAGYPNGFKFRVQVASSQNPDLITLVASYLQKVGVTVELVLSESGAMQKALFSGTNEPGFYMVSSITNPTTSLRKNFTSRATFNPARHADPEFDKKVDDLLAEPDERIRQVKVRLLTREIVDKAPYIWLPVPYVYTAWWPWVRNYGGELRAGAERPGPIHARIWVDQVLKKKMGY
ncbi:MAG: ABC transporter substrate-binding protein [Burkholderiales bacterium]|nr:ABC transporter substrate-binding protein [Burkholderiales bacterium]